MAVKKPSKKFTRNGKLKKKGLKAWKHLAGKPTKKAVAKKIEQEVHDNLGHMDSEPGDDVLESQYDDAFDEAIFEEPDFEEEDHENQIPH